MDIVLQLYSTLILTLLGFVLPILSIAIAMLPEGVSCLSSKYENEKKQSEENLVNETQKKTEGTGLDYVQLEKTIKILKKKKSEAIKKLSYLEPTKLILRISIPFFLSLIIFVFVAITKELNVKIIFLFFSILSFVAGLIALWESAMILVEVSGSINQKKKNYEEKMVELLSTIAEKGGSDFFVKDGITAIFNGKLLKKDVVLEFSTNRPYEIPVSINNSGELMAKNVEIAFVFSKDFLVENTSNITNYTSETSQIVRLNNDMVQAHENLNKGKMKITFLKPGVYPIDTFIKGENVKYNKFIFSIKVIE